VKVAVNKGLIQRAGFVGHTDAAAEGDDVGWLISPPRRTIAR
jgi:hypothetical protein